MFGVFTDMADRLSYLEHKISFLLPKINKRFKSTVVAGDIPRK